MTRGIRRSIGVLILALLAPVSTAHAAFEFTDEWGTVGQGTGQFDEPFGIAADAAGNVYVSDCGLHRVQKFTSGGTFITTWGSGGPANGQFDCPYQVATDTAGNVYVADNGNDRIQKFTSSGTFIRSFGSTGDGNGEFKTPAGVAVDAAGNIYVAEEGNNRVQVLTSSGGFLRKWGSAGADPEQFSQPRGVNLDAAGNVLVGDYNNTRIQKFTATGDFIEVIDHTGPPGALDRVNNVAISPTTGQLLAADESGDRALVFDPAGVFESSFGAEGTGAGQFQTPTYSAFDCAGNAYITDYSNSRVQKFTDPSASPATPPTTMPPFCGFRQATPPVVPPPADVAAPVISGASVTNRVFRVDRNGAVASQRRRKPPAKKGTTFKLTVSEAGTARIAIQRRAKGRKVAGKCRKPTRANRRKKACARFIKVGAFTDPVTAGANRIKFSGRLLIRGKARALKPGRYRALITATDAAGNKSPARRVTFRVVKR